MSGEWGLPPLAGISTAPLLSSTGSIRTGDGYDPGTGLWCRSVPTLSLLAEPSRTDANEELRRLRQTFRTFPFADASRRWDSSLGVEVVDLGTPPGRDESAFLVNLLTAACRPSLPLAPGALYTAPEISGAGSGKGLLVRAISMIAFGISPSAFTMGSDRHELEKRLAAELMEAHPVVFLDNANGRALRSDTLASVLTERPARVRVLGRSLMVPLNSTAFIAITGNGLTLTEDLARRFIPCELDARCEDPELRPFASGFLKEIEARRAELLAAALTIWRWGRRNAAQLTRGKPLGSYELWAEWCRDPLLNLGCQDPVERIEALKANDPHRQRIGELFRTWWQHHGADITKAADLAEPVKAIADPQGRGRQYLATLLSRLSGTHAAGFVLTRQEPASKWTAATYVLTEVAASSRLTGHRTHRTDGTSDSGATSAPMSPMSPDGSYGSYGSCGSYGSYGSYGPPWVYARCRRQRRRPTRRRGGDMSVAHNLLADLAGIGATIKPAGDRLILRAGRTAIPAELVSRVRAAKTDLLATLSASSERPGNEEARGHDRKPCKNIGFRIVEWLNSASCSISAGVLRMVRKTGSAKRRCSSIRSGAGNARVASCRVLARLASREKGRGRQSARA